MSLNRDAQQREVDRQVADMLGRSSAYRALPPGERAEIMRNTSAIVATMAQNRMAQGQRPSARVGAPSVQASADPFAIPMDASTGGLAPGVTLPGTGLPGTGGTQKPTFTGGAQPGSSLTFGPKKEGDFGTGVATGVGQAGELLRQVNFPAFVAELVQGVFQAVVDASIQQMKAYGEMVQGITMSLNDFRDANVTDNQARDHLVSKFPQLMQINVTDAGPRVGLRPDADTDNLPDIGAALGMDKKITDLDDESTEQELVLAARNDLARSRQGLLATMLLMGINRIVVTDGKINAKMTFDFKARDTMTDHAQNYDYKNYGQTTAYQGTHESGETTGENYSQTSGWMGGNRSGESNRWTKGTDQWTSAPAIYLKAVDDKVTTAELEAKAKLSGEVSLNFKSETFDLNKLASADEVFRMERVRSSAGRGAPAAGGGAAAPGGTAAAPGSGAGGGASGGGSPAGGNRSGGGAAGTNSTTTTSPSPSA